MKRSQLKRKTPPKARKVALKQGRKLPAMSAETKADLPRRRAVWENVKERDQVCQLAVRLQAHPEFPAHSCQGDLTPQHIVKSGQGGPYTEANLAAVCWLGNSVWIEQHRREATVLGLHRNARKPAWPGLCTFGSG